MSNPDTDDVLSRLLYNKSPEIQARLRKFATKRDIDVEDPLWQALILLESFPLHIEQQTVEHARSLQEIQAHLEAWQLRNLAALSSLSQHLETLKQLTPITEVQIEQSQAAQTGLSDLMPVLEGLQVQAGQTTETLASLEQQLVVHHADVSKLTTALNAFSQLHAARLPGFMAPLPSWKQALFWGVLFGGFFMAVSVSSLVIVWHNDRKILLNSAQTTELIREYLREDYCDKRQGEVPEFCL